MVTLDKVSKFIISDMCFHVPRGECVGLIGASGAGKTTLLKLVCGLLKPREGYVRILGKDPVQGRGHYGRDLSVFMVGKWSLEDGDTVRQAFVLLQNIYRLPKQDFWQEYDKLAKRFDFLRYEKEVLKNLSLGQRMRVELAATLIGAPKLIVLDEPNVGLDENGKLVLWEMIKESCNRGATVLMASHNLEEMAAVCTRLALLDKGALLYYGTEKNLRSRYASIDVMRMKLIGELPDLEDLPLREYCICGNELQLSYDSNYLPAAEILSLILKQTRVAEVSVTKPDLADIILQIKEAQDTQGACVKSNEEDDQ